MNRKVAVLRLSRLSVPEKIEKARFIVTSMTGNANFTTPVPALTVITTHANALETAHIAARGGGMDETANMHAKELALELSLKLLGAYVEGTANGDPSNAEAIILSSGMELKGQGIRAAREFTVEPSDKPGEVRLFTKHAPRATFIWQMSTTPDKEESWQTIGQGTQARLIKNSLVSGTRYHFRVAVVDKNGLGPWSHVLNTIAL